MQFSIHPITGTENHVIRQRSAGSSSVVLVAEVVKGLTGYSVLRMDATGVLANNLPSPLSALSFYTLWVKDTGPVILGLDIDPIEAHGAGLTSVSPEENAARPRSWRSR